MLIITIVLGISAQAHFIRGQAVTFADFSHIRQVAASSSHVYFLTTQGITRYSKENRTWEEPLTGTDGINHEDIQHIWVDIFDNKLYAETSMGLHEYDLLFESWFPVTEVPELNSPSRHISPPSIMYPPAGFNYDGGTGHFIDFWGRYFQFIDVLDDGSGDLWIGTWGYGALAAGSASHYLELLPYGLLQNRVNTIYDDDGILWVSGAIADDDFRTGLTTFDPDKGEFSYIESGITPDFPAVDVNCLTGNDDNIYIGTPFGLLILDRQTRQISRQITTRDGFYNENVLSVLVTGDTLFAGTAEGLAMITLTVDSTRVVRPTQFADAIVYDLEKVGATIWIASSAGAYRLKLGSGKLQRFLDPDMVLFGDVYDIEQFEQYLWFLSDEGLVMLNTETAESQSYNKITNRLTPNALAVNDTIAVVASDKGLTILFHANKKPYTRDFTTADGLPSNFIYTVLMDGDYLWLGSDKGLTRFLWNNPERID
ncbi:MAG: hypothetical protein DRP47_09700 [Candidatus Zixiibacteriota bacterium]|nr:MAG: hypothetical protein DRP47_09700 [candidate division Zixibacteria bacterium]